MILISHRGNLDGKSKMENNPVYVEFAIHMGFDVEVDVWRKDGQWWLGHDEPTHKIKEGWLEDRRSDLWCHAKNMTALKYLVGINMHCFGHDKDKYALTSNGYVWAHPNTKWCKGVIGCLPEEGRNEVTGCVGICSDYIGRYI